MIQSLGIKEKVNLHLDVYSVELKNLIGKLNDQSADSISKDAPKMEIKSTQAAKMNNFDVDEDANKHSGNDDGLKAVADSGNNERKEKLKIRLMNES